MPGLKFTPGCRKPNQPGGFLDPYRMMMGWYESPTGTDCGCTSSPVCWTRYDNTVSDPGSNPGAPLPLGGPTENPPRSETYSRFWDDLTPGESHPQDTTDIWVTGNAIVRNTIPVDRQSCWVQIAIDHLSNGDKPRIFFNRVDSTHYCYLQFVATNENPEIGMYKVSGITTTKLRRFVNHDPTFIMDGTRVVRSHDRH